MTTEKPAPSLSENFLAKKSNMMMSLLAVFLLAGMLIFLKYLKPKKLAEIFQITGAYQAYFEIEADKTSDISQGEDVNIDIYLTTSGEDFDAAVAIIEWDAGNFAYKNVVGGLSAQFLSSFFGDNQGKRVMTHFVPVGDTPMTALNNQATKFATLTLTAQVDNPSSQVKLSSNLDDLTVHFVDAGVDNSCDQSLADQSRLSVQLGDPGAAPTPTPVSTPTPAPTPPPTGTDTVQLRVKASFLGRSEGDWEETIKLCLVGRSDCQEVQLDNSGLSSLVSFDGISAGETYTLQAQKRGYLSVSKQQVLYSGDNGTVDMGQMPSGDLNIDDQINSLDWSWMKLNFGQSGE